MDVRQNLEGQRQLLHLPPIVASAALPQASTTVTPAQPGRTIAAAGSERYAVSPLMVWSPPETAAPVRLSVQRTGAAAGRVKQTATP